MYRKLITLSLLFVAIAAFTVGSVYIGYLFFMPQTDETKDIVLAAAGDGDVREEAEPDNPAENSEAEPAAGIDSEPSRITDKTRIIYEYNTQGHAESELREVSMPYYFLGMSEEKLDNTLIEGWSIKEFNEDIVILSRMVEESAQDIYTLGVHNGYIAVFYNDKTLADSIKETTGTPISTLSIEEQNRLLDGILITGEDQLVKVLEDYGS